MKDSSFVAFAFGLVIIVLAFIGLASLVVMLVSKLVPA